MGAYASLAVQDMNPVTIYITKLCPYCFAARQLLDEKGALVREIDVTFAPELRLEMSEQAGGASSVPQIFIGDRHVGGCDDLYALDDSGELDALLAGDCAAERV